MEGTRSRFEYLNRGEVPGTKGCFSLDEEEWHAIPTPVSAVALWKLGEFLLGAGRRFLTARMVCRRYSPAWGAAQPPVLGGLDGFYEKVWPSSRTARGADQRNAWASSWNGPGMVGRAGGSGVLLTFIRHG